MNTDELNQAFEKLFDAFREFSDALIKVLKPYIEETVKKIEEFLDFLRETIDKEEQQKWRFPVKKSKKDYLHNQRVSAYRIDRRPIKNLPYMRRNY